MNLKASVERSLTVALLRGLAPTGRGLAEGSLALRLFRTLVLRPARALSAAAHRLAEKARAVWLGSRAGALARRAGGLLLVGDYLDRPTPRLAGAIRAARVWRWTERRFWPRAGSLWRKLRAVPAGTALAGLTERLGSRISGPRGLMLFSLAFLAGFYAVRLAILGLAPADFLLPWSAGPLALALLLAALGLSGRGGRSGPGLLERALAALRHPRRD